MKSGQFDDHHHLPLGLPIEVNGQQWIAQTAFWARAVTVVAFLAGGAILLVADWNVVGLPTNAGIALVWAAPSISYFTMSFFAGKFHGNICRAIAIFAITHAIAILVSAAFAGDPDQLTLRLILAFALVAGLTNLVISAYWAWRWICQPSFFADRRQGFEVLDPPQIQSIDSDLGK